ncbi:MAG: DUF1801 domain-containing protein [Chitinophagales bacterium]|nr:DUF1801 domain-containing protein [Chitinophagales bacterium]
MSKLQITTTPDVQQVFDRYPDHIKNKISNLRRLILESANEVASITQLEETLKWGEPSYLVKKGSTIRIDWKEKKPDQYGMYFQCTTKLVPSFKIAYGGLFRYEGNRAILFSMDEQIDEEALKNCIKAGLTYHKVKHLPTLGL